MGPITERERGTYANSIKFAQGECGDSRFFGCPAHSVDRRAGCQPGQSALHVHCAAGEPLEQEAEPQDPVSRDRPAASRSRDEYPKDRGEIPKALQALSAETGR